MSADDRELGGKEGVEAIITAQSDVEFSSADRIKQVYREQIYAPFFIVWQDWRARVGLLLLLPYIIVGLIGHRFVDPTRAGDGPRLQPWFQSLEHPLGTTHLGMDLFAMTVNATPLMLEMILAGGAFTVIVATIVGILSGYKGGTIDYVLTMITDIAINIPGLPLVIVLAAIINPERIWVVGVIIAVPIWAGLARAIRSQVLTLRKAEYVEASRTMGMPTHYIMRKDIMPNLMPYIAMNFMETARTIIFAGVALYFLGILPYTNQNWGVMLNQAYIRQAHTSVDRLYWLLVPIIAIAVLSIGLILFSQGMDRLFNPRVRARIEQDGDRVESIEEDEEGPQMVGGGPM